MIMPVKFSDCFDRPDWSQFLIQLLVQTWPEFIQTAELRRDTKSKRLMVQQPPGELPRSRSVPQAQEASVRTLIWEPACHENTTCRPVLLVALQHSLSRLCHPAHEQRWFPGRTANYDVNFSGVLLLESHVPLKGGPVRMSGIQSESSSETGTHWPSN